MSRSSRFALVGALFWIVLAGPRTPARAVIGTLDTVPAATLLVPYFVEDLADTQGLGMTTLVVVSNAAGRAALAKVTLWTDAGIPTFSFHIYLTGYDAQSFRVRDVFDGVLPITASDQFDPMDTISPQGPRSQDVSFVCNADDFSAAALTEEVRARLARQHRGVADPVTNLCSGSQNADGYARGYITIDVVNRCSPLLPGEPGYFVADGTGIATTSNQLVGEVRYVHPAQNFAWGDVAVHIEADASAPATSTNGAYTFYGRLVGWSAADHREPLATRWAAPYPSATAGQLVVWRDPKVRVAPFPCFGARGRTPPGQWIAFDMSEGAYDISRLVPQLGVTQSLVLGRDLLLPARAGWVHIALSSPAVGAVEPGAPGVSQGWAGVVGTLDLCGGEGRYIGGFGAAAYDNASAPIPPYTLGLPEIQP